MMKGVWKSGLAMATWNVRIMLIPGKKKRKTSFDMDGRCGGRPEGNEDGDAAR